MNILNWIFHPLLEYEKYKLKQMVKRVVVNYHLIFKEELAEFKKQQEFRRELDKKESGE